MPQQLHAGYLLDGVSDHWRRDARWKGLLAHLSCFEVEYDIPNSRPVHADSIVAVFTNLISRGAPTRASVYLEQEIAKLLKQTVPDPEAKKQGDIFYSLINSNADFEKLLLRSLHVIDPRVRYNGGNLHYTPSWEKLESSFEEGFFLSVLPKRLGNDFILQSIEPQKGLEEILNYPQPLKKKYELPNRGDFTQQRVDFALPFPYSQLDKWGVIMEVDGPQHNQPNQISLDRRRDEAAKYVNWADTIRVTHLNDQLTGLQIFRDEPYLKTLRENFDSPLYASEFGHIALQLVLTPVAVARIQRVIAAYMLHGWLNLESKTWRIAVLERDVPAAFLAIEDLKEHFKHLFALEGKGRQLPEIDLSVFNTPEFAESGLNKGYQGIIRPILKATGSGNYDLVIDCSTLLRGHFIRMPESLPTARMRAVIRSSFGPRSERKFVSEPPVTYQSLFLRELTDEERLSGFIEPGTKIDETVDHGKRSFEKDVLIPERHAGLQFFLRSIFRKETFRPGQLPIIDLALQRKNVIGLLPTGGGKSLTYQLPALLQPGICIIVDPIKSLMKDQVDGLQRNFIDAANFINSMLKTSVERAIALDKVVKGEVLFTFVSPERLLIKKFREALREMSQSQSNGFSYAVVDEAHCVSEWGHDFRTAYLRLGANLRTYCWEHGAILDAERGVPKTIIPIIGLTATASYDVLTDIQRELGIESTSIIQSSGLDRPELNYKVITAPFAGGFGFDGRSGLAEIKRNLILSLLQNQILSDLIQSGSQTDPVNFYFESGGEYRNAGLLFCPHRESAFGVIPTHNYIQERLNLVKSAIFVGANSDTTTTSIDDDPYIKAQDDFINNHLNLLVATKAFGMGIDKKNIRYTIHFNYPNSIESFYQEAGRAGRDRKPAMCYILFAGHEIEADVLKSFHNNSFKGTGKDLAVLREILHEIEKPGSRIIGTLAEIIREEIGNDIILRLGTGQYENLLFANYGYNKRYGHVDLISMRYWIKPEDFSADACENVMQLVVRILQEKCPPGRVLKEWLEEEVPTTKELGLLQILAKMGEREMRSAITIGFWNDRFNQIARRLECADSIVRKAYGFCQSSSDFISNLRRENINVGGNAPFVEENFPHLRDEQDTFKAIYRLGIIGVVDDYEVDYHTKTISFRVIKRHDEAYIENLHQYLQRYVSIERAKEVLEIVKPSPSKTIERCLEYLVTFVYNEIAAKRNAAIKSMEEACILGQSKGSEEFKEILKIHFNSKYYLDLVKRTEQGRAFDFETVWGYADITEGNVDNLKHLRGACVRILTEQPTNGALLLLKAYSTLLLDYTDSRLVEDARVEITNGFSEFLKAGESTIEELSQEIDKYKTKLAVHNLGSGQIVDDAVSILYIRHYTDWLTNFNHKFLANYA